MVVAEVCSSMKYPKRCQYKHAKQKKYHVRNWAEYNEGLRRRGDLTVWFDEEAIANWKADKTGKPGGQRVYSDMAIETGLVVRMVYKLAYRQTEGVIVYRSGLTKGTGVLSGARRIDVTMSITRIPL